ncbi:Kynureninase [Trichinella sp. T8]|nr:Kynureninase [Trichinella sp. T8]
MNYVGKAMLEQKDETMKAKLERIAQQQNLKVTDAEFAEFLDSVDELSHFRKMFKYPKMSDLPKVDLNLVDAESDAIYLCGNSLGLQPKDVQEYISEELDKWAKMYARGVYGHTNGKMPWAKCDEFVLDTNAALVGAKKCEIAVMNSLTINLHLLMYAVHSQVRFHGFDPEECVVVLQPRQNEHCLRTEDILDYISQNGQSIALVLFSGVQYYTGQYFDIPSITACGKAQGCIVGWDLAHAAGNVPLNLHEWKVDFAAWCSYKYLNSGCGGLSIVFIHENNFDSYPPALWGWWGHEAESRMEMTNEMKFPHDCSAYRISHPPALLVCPMIASLKIYEKTSMQMLRQKSKLLTAYLEYLVNYYFGKMSTVLKNPIYCEVITPQDPEQRGCQLSLKFSANFSDVYDQLQKRGVVCDMRFPDVLRITPVHIYNSFNDVRRFTESLIDSFEQLSSGEQQ